MLVYSNVHFEPYIGTLPNKEIILAVPCALFSRPSLSRCLPLTARLRYCFSPLSFGRLLVGAGDHDL